MEKLNLKHLDLTYLIELSDGSDDFIKEMISVFMTETPLDIESLEKHLKSKDWQALSATAHKMKSSVSIMGINDSIDTLKMIEENASQETNLDSLPELITKTKKFCIDAIKELAEI